VRAEPEVGLIGAVDFGVLPIALFAGVAKIYLRIYIILCINNIALERIVFKHKLL